VISTDPLPDEQQQDDRGGQRPERPGQSGAEAQVGEQGRCPRGVHGGVPVRGDHRGGPQQRKPEERVRRHGNEVDHDEQGRMNAPAGRVHPEQHPEQQEPGDHEGRQHRQVPEVVAHQRAEQTGEVQPVQAADVDGQRDQRVTQEPQGPAVQHQQQPLPRAAHLRVRWTAQRPQSQRDRGAPDQQDRHDRRQHEVLHQVHADQHVCVPCDAQAGHRAEQQHPAHPGHRAARRPGVPRPAQPAQPAHPGQQKGRSHGQADRQHVQDGRQQGQRRQRPLGQRPGTGDARRCGVHRCAEPQGRDEDRRRRAGSCHHQDGRPHRALHLEESRADGGRGSAR
jgi:hypothetical protein